MELLKIARMCSKEPFMYKCSLQCKKPELYTGNNSIMKDLHVFLFFFLLLVTFISYFGRDLCLMSGKGVLFCYENEKKGKR